MARVLGFLLGELRGKLGGTVFSRNKSGAIVRAKVTPVNPQTVRQQTARFRFGNASILFQNLSVNAKSCWETFAKTHFNPLRGNNTGIYSGGNAFVALQQSVGQGNEYKQVPGGLQGNLTFDVSTVPYTVLGAPPLTPTSSTIKDNLFGNHPIVITTMSMDALGNVGYALTFPDVSPTSPLTFNSFVNAETQPFGIGIYLSNTLKFEGSKPNTALKLQLTDTGVVTVIDKTVGSGGALLSEPFFVLQPSQIDVATCRDFPCAGDWVLMTPFVRSFDGAQKLMNPQYVQVSTAP